jgi:hypothetical protein
MPFVKREGESGLFFVPEENNKPKKHPCCDCFSCQWCDDVRCELCLKRQKCKFEIDNKKGSAD